MECTRLVEPERGALRLDLWLGHPGIESLVLADVHHEEAHRPVNRTAVPAEEMADALHPIFGVGRDGTFHLNHELLGGRGIARADLDNEVQPDVVLPLAA